ncbi:MAG: cadherin-like domain-containing protein [Gammaproteobacteria bacterium]|nr:cadherin-like domain-containing protein [Gammaproteobacteria bacterium]
MKKTIITGLFCLLFVGCGGGIQLANQPNNKPVAQDDVYEINEDEPLELNALFNNDTDLDSDKLTLAAYTSPEFGTLSRSETGILVFQPHTDFTGSDSFTYTVSDGHGGTDSANVKIVVNNINDAPVFTDKPIAIFTDQVNTPLMLLDSGAIVDVDSPVLAFELISKTSKGSISLNDAGELRYTPTPGYTGRDSFIVKVSDGELSSEGTVVLNVGDINYAPVASNDEITAARTNSITFNVFDNDTDPNQDKLIMLDWTPPSKGNVLYIGEGVFSYTPHIDSDSGTDEFSYTVGDNRGGKAKGTVSIEIAQDWGNRSTHSENSDFSNQIIDDAGNITLVWTSANKHKLFHLWTRRYDADEAKWLEAKRMDQKDEGRQFKQIDLRSDASGNVTLSWLFDENGRGVIHANRYELATGWSQSPTVVSNITNNSSFGVIPAFDVASDKLGNVSFLWYQKVSSTYDLLHAHYNAANDSWLSAQRIPLNIEQTNSAAQISVSNGIIALTWLENQTLKAQYSVNNLGVWSNNAGEAVSLPGANVSAIENVQLMQDSAGNIQVLWSQIVTPTGGSATGDGLWIKSVNIVDKAWSDAYRISAPLNVSRVDTLALAQSAEQISSDLIVVWQQDTQLYANASRFGNSWDASLAKLVSDGTQTGAIGEIVLLQSGEGAIAIWEQRNASDSFSNYWSNSFGFDEKDELKIGLGSISSAAAVIVDNNSGPIAEFQALVDQSGKVHALWIQDETNNGNTITSVYANQFTTSSNWKLKPSLISVDNIGAAETLGTPKSLHAEATDESEVIAIWEYKFTEIDVNITHQIWTNTFDTLNWSESFKLSDDSNIDHQLKYFGISDNGNAFSIWSSYDGEHETLFVRERKTGGEAWQAGRELNVSSQYTISVSDVLYNPLGLPSVFGFSDITDVSSGQLWSVDFR